ncbi:MAG TPA: glycosyltransferase [Anaerolineaceae bacterium]|jgi:glycosyltransferase involved in cell wall biosynthesis
MKIALIHDYLFEYGGSERVVEQILRVYPQADVFSLFDFLPQSGRAIVHGKPVQTTFLQNIPWVRRNPARYLPYLVPLMPFAVEQIDLSGYDLVLSSSHSVAKGVLTGPDQLHIAYVHSPMRYAWDQQRDYMRSSVLRSGLKGKLGLAMLTWMRLWDTRTANGVDQFAANSHFIARRIQKVYRREASVIYPPVDIDAFPLCEQKGAYYLVVSRMAPYKRVDLIVEAFKAMPDQRLVVIGSGPEEKPVRRAAGENVRFLGYQSREDLARWMGGARALIQAAQEDFGITTVEAQAAGTPVIAYHKGGAAEIVHGADDLHPTGIFFNEQTAECLTQAVHEMQAIHPDIRPQDCRLNAERFNPGRFRSEYRSLVESAVTGFGDLNASPIPLELPVGVQRGRE